MTSPPILPEEREQLASEMALGVLDGEELARAEALFAQDPEFRAEVGSWLGRLAPLLADVAPVEPPQGLWQAIERRLGARPSANDNAAAVRRRLNVWRGIAAGASAIAASLAVILVTRAPEQPPAVSVPARAEPMIAMLGDEQKRAMLVASWSPESRRLSLKAAAPMPAEPAKVHELWMIPADGTPRSLGMLPDDRPMQMQVEPAMSAQLLEGVSLAVSVEPMGGSPTGLPTGPVIASGKLERA